MKKIVFIFLLTVLFSFQKQSSSFSDYPISSVDVREVIIDDHFWLPKIKLIQDITIKYALDKCENEGRMENFLIAGGRKKGEKLGNMPFDDTDLYKIIEGASYTLISSPNKELDSRLDRLIEIIRIGQEQDGYLSTWFTINPSKPGNQWFKPATKRWEFEEFNHELYNSGHLFEAASAHYLATGKRNFLEIALKNADLLVANFGSGKLQLPPGHQIVETGLIKLYRITHRQKYLDLAKQFLDWRGNSATHKLYGEYSQDHLPVIQQTEAVGHAVRAVYMYAGMTDIAAIYQDSSYRAAIDKIWENVVNKKTYITGGIGSIHDGEKFGNSYELPNLTAYNETCASIGSVSWNQRMFQLTGNSQYIDVIERTLYNGLVSGISTDGKKFFYPNPLESDGKYPFNQGSCSRSEWFDCSCCPTNLIRFIPSLPSIIYATQKDKLYINLYIANKAKLNVNNQKLEMTQNTDYPNSGSISLLINPPKEVAFHLMLRIPGWAQNSVLPGHLYEFTKRSTTNIKLLLNGKEQRIKLVNGYADVYKMWKKGDKVELVLPLEIRKIIANPEVKENKNKLAIAYGPIVYCAEEIDNKNLSTAKIGFDETFVIAKTKIETSETPMLIGQNSGLKLIPYYLWSNRGIGKMNVWFSYQNLSK